jgi:uncharacterized protein
MPASALRGRFVWHELMTTDPDAAARFYPGVTGWKVQAWEQDPSYRLWKTGAALMGGLMRLPEEARRMGTRPSWLVYVGVPDVDASVRHATSLGARALVPPQTIPVGCFAVLADPQGAAFAVYKPSPEPPEPKDDEVGVGDFCWHELATRDYKAAWEFYRALFGWESTEAMDMGPGGVYWMFGRAGRSLGGMYNKPREMPAAPHWLCYVRVPNADTAAAAVTRLGGRLLNGPMEVPGGARIAQVQDPQGAAFAVHSLVVARAAAKPEAKAKKKPARPKARKAAPKREKKAAKKRRRG